MRSARWGLSPPSKRATADTPQGAEGFNECRLRAALCRRNAEDHPGDPCSRSPAGYKNRARKEMTLHVPTPIPCPVVAARRVAGRSGRGRSRQKGRPRRPAAGRRPARAGTVRWRHGTTLTFLAFLPDGKTIVSAGVDGKIRFWERTSGRERRRIDMGSAPASAPPGGRRPTRGGRFGFGSSLALAPDGKRLAWSAGGGIRLWDVTANKELARVAETGGRVVSLAFAADGKTLAGLASDGTLRLWDGTGRLLRNWQIPGADSGMRGRGGPGGRGGRALRSSPPRCSFLRTARRC